jgi:hypothetical protein
MGILPHPPLYNFANAVPPLQSVASSWSVHNSEQNAPTKMDGARKNIVDYVLHTKRPIVIDSFKNSDFYDPLLAIEIGSVLCVPIGLKV